MDVTVGEYKNFIQDLKAGWTEALAGFFDDLSRQYLTKQQQWERTARLFYERADCDKWGRSHLLSALPG